MAIKKFTIDGYGQLELNQAPFRRDGSIEAQCKIDTDSITEGYIENGMLLAIDHANRTVGYPTDASDVIALNYTTEHMYDQREEGLKHFKLDAGTVLPRLGYLSSGLKFTTNTLAYDDSEFTDDEALKTAAKAVKVTPLYGAACENGRIKVTATAEGAVCKVVKATTMPDGQFAIQFVAVK